MTTNKYNVETLQHNSLLFFALFVKYYALQYSYLHYDSEWG